MNTRKHEIPGVEILPPTIFSAKQAARAALRGDDARSPIGLLRDLAEAYVSLPGATERVEREAYANYRHPTRNPWQKLHLREGHIAEVAIQEENGPIGVRLTENGYYYKRRFTPGLAWMGHLAYHEGSMTQSLTVATPLQNGKYSRRWTNLDVWAEMGVQQPFIESVYFPEIEALVDLPDEPRVVPFSDDLRLALDR